MRSSTAYAALLVVQLACGKTESKPVGEAVAAGEVKARDAASRAVVDAAPSAPARPERDAPPAETRTLRGVVRLATGARLPTAPDPRKSNLITPPISPCTPISDGDMRVVTMGEGGGLTPIHVAATGMKYVPAGAPHTHVVRIVDCRMQPDLVGARVGDIVRFENASQAVIAPSFPGDSFLSTVAPGGHHEVQVRNVGVGRAGCAMGPYCAGTSIVAVAHPFWDVTDPAGRFELANLPLGESITLHAWHPLFDEASVTLTVDDAAAAREWVLELRPHATAAEPPPQPQPAKAKRPTKAKSPS